MHLPYRVRISKTNIASTYALTIPGSDLKKYLTATCVLTILGLDQQQGNYHQADFVLWSAPSSLNLLVSQGHHVDPFQDMDCPWQRRKKIAERKGKQ